MKIEGACLREICEFPFKSSGTCGSSSCCIASLGKTWSSEDDLTRFQIGVIILMKLLFWLSKKKSCGDFIPLVKHALSFILKGSLISILSTNIHSGSVCMMNSECHLSQKSYREPSDGFHRGAPKILVMSARRDISSVLKCEEYFIMLSAWCGVDQDRPRERYWLYVLVRSNACCRYFTRCP